MEVGRTCSAPTKPEMDQNGNYRDPQSKERICRSVAIWKVDLKKQPAPTGFK